MTRPPLVQIKPPERPKCREYDPLISSTLNFLDKFEEGDPPEVVPYETPKQKRKKYIQKKIVDKK